MIKHLEESSYRDHLLNISHIYDLKAYFQFVKTPKNHYFYKMLYQKENDNTKSAIFPKSRMSFRKSSLTPKVDILSGSTPEEIQFARKIEKMSEDERKEANKKLDKEKKQRMHEIMKRIKEEEKFLFNLNKIREKIKKEHRELYLGRTFISFKSLDLCVSYLKMFQSDLQKEALANANDEKFDYLLKIETKLAPFIDDLRWEHMSSPKHYYLLEIMFVLVVSGVNMYLEKWYNQSNLHEMVVNKRSLSNPSWLLPLLLLLLMQVLLSVVSIVCIEKLISRYTFYKRSKKIEINFIFFNSFLILNNIMVVFYGFLWAAYDIGQKLSDGNKYYYNFYINFQWIKNSLIIIFIPLLQRLVGDYLIKWQLLPWFSQCCKKHRHAASKQPAAGTQQKREDEADGGVDDSKEADEQPPEELDSEEMSDEEPAEGSQNPALQQQRPKKKKPIHDFGLNSSYLIQVAFFTGFYLSFTSPLLLLITFLGVWLNYLFEKYFLKSMYDKTKFVSISNMFITLRWGFVAFCIGLVVSIMNSLLYMWIIRSKNSDIAQLSKVAGFQNMIGYCNFVIACIFFVQMNTSRIMFRVLNSINALKKKYGGSFFKEEFERNNFKTQNPFYSLSFLQSKGRCPRSQIALISQTRKIG